MSGHPQANPNADARLMKLAPDLLEALEDLVACAEMLEEFTDPNSDWYIALLEAQNVLIRAREDA